MPIASITKLMTAMVMLDAGLPLDEPITISRADVDTLKGTGSRLGWASRCPRREMLRLALMASENRAAAALARSYPGGTPAFVPAMNSKAKQLGHARYALRRPHRAQSRTTCRPRSTWPCWSTPATTTR